MFTQASTDPPRPFDAAVVIPTLLRPTLERAVRAVFAQDLAGRVQILIGIDVAEGDRAVLGRLRAACPERMALTVCDLPYSTSVRHGGLYPNRFGGALRSILTLSAHSRRVAFLDDDNWWTPDHLSSLASALDGVDWAFSRRHFADPESGEPICLDDWESVGPGAGVFQEQFGGFVDPSSLMIDKLRCHDVVGLWALAAFEDGSGEDRLVFSGLNGRHPWRATGRATCRYAMNDRDRNHAARVQRLRELGIVPPAERRAGRQTLADVIAGFGRGAGEGTAAPAGGRVLAELLARLKPAEIVALACGDGAAAAMLAETARAQGLAPAILAADDWSPERYRAVSADLGPDVALLPPSLGPAGDYLALRRVAVDLVHLGRVATIGEAASAFALLRRGGILMGPGDAPVPVAELAAAEGAGLLPAELDGVRCWLVQKG
jgi:hypothetical protein